MGMVLLSFDFIIGKCSDFDGCSSDKFVGKRGVFKSGLMPISSLENSVVTCM